MRRGALLLLGLILLVPQYGQRVTTRRTIFNLGACDRTTFVNAVASAADGDTIICPPGAWSWSSTVFLSKSLNIQGAGIGVTTITSSIAQTGGNHVNSIIDWNTKPTGGSPAGLSRLADMTIDGGSGGTDSQQTALINITGTTSALMIQRVRVNMTRQESIRIRGNIVGVMSGGGVFSNGFFGASIRVDHTTWGGNTTSCSNNGGCGDKSWSEPTGLGQQNSAFYVEDTTLQSAPAGFQFASDGWNGSRVVYRFNQINDTSLGNHGTETGQRERGARSTEFYENNCHYTTAMDSCMGSRGGTGVTFNNDATWSGGGFLNKVWVVSTYRAEEGDTSHNAFVPWGACAIRPVSAITRSGNVATATVSSNHYMQEVIFGQGNRIEIRGASDSLYNGEFVVNSRIGGTQFTYLMAGTPGANASGTLTVRAPYDGNTDATGWPCLDQVGAGQQTTQMSGEMPAGLPLNVQALEPVYVWNNTRQGSIQHTVEGPLGGDAMNPNRDYYDQAHATNSACSGAFNGTCGVGIGVSASRPGTCTAGVAYWATNEGEWNSTNGGTPDGRLYKCTSTNTWTLYYTPLAYPHPLLSPSEVATTISTPTTDLNYDTQTSTVTITGVATDNSAVTGSTWVNGGSSGACTGTTAYTCASIPLTVGVNTIVITTTDDTAHTAQDELLVQRLATGPSPPSDAFTRADWPTLGAWWTHQGGTPEYDLVNNRAVGVGSNFDCAFWNQEVAVLDQFSEAAIVSVADTARAARVTVRASGTGPAFNAYFLSTDGLSGSGHTFLGKFIAGALSVLVPVATTYSPGDVMRVSIVGDTLTAWKNGVEVAVTAAGGELTSGQYGACLYGPNASIDSWSGGAAEEGGEPPPPDELRWRLRLRGGGQ